MKHQKDTTEAGGRKGDRNMNELKTIGFIMVMLISISLIALPATLVAAEEAPPQPPAQADTPWWARINATFDEVLALAYLVRNETYPVYQFAIENNVTLANATLARGDYFLQLAINTSTTNETLAKAYALVATVIYSRGPVFAYIVLGKTIKSELGPNRTVTEETAEAALNKTLELRSLLDEAISIAQENNVTVPDAVFILRTLANGLINATQELIDQGYYRAALRTTIRAYHNLVSAYGIVVKATIAQKLELGEPENVSVRLGLRRISRHVLEKIVEHLPPRIREKILSIIRERHIRSPEELRTVIREIMKYYYRRMANFSVDATAMIATKVVYMTMMNPLVPFEQRQAIRTWMMEKGFLRNKVALYNYVRGIAAAKYQELNVTGMKLLNATLSALSQDITSSTGIEVDLVHIFHVYLIVHWHFHRHH